MHSSTIHINVHANFYLCQHLLNSAEFGDDEENENCSRWPNLYSQQFSPGVPGVPVYSAKDFHSLNLTAQKTVCTFPFDGLRQIEEKLTHLNFSQIITRGNHKG